MDCGHRSGLRGLLSRKVTKMSPSPEAFHQIFGRQPSSSIPSSSIPSQAMTLGLSQGRRARDSAAASFSGCQSSY